MNSTIYVNKKFYNDSIIEAIETNVKNAQQMLNVLQYTAKRLGVIEPTGSNGNLIAKKLLNKIINNDYYAVSIDGDILKVYYNGQVKELSIKKDNINKSVRKIFILDSIVLKLDGIRQIQIQCENEVKTYNRIDSEDLENFAEVLEYGQGWTIQKKVNFSTVWNRELSHDVIYSAKIKLNKIASKYGIADMHDENYGINNENNSLIIFDYGIGNG